MNKQEVIEKLQSEARHHCGEKECYKDGCTKNVELDIAIDIVNQLDEPKKPVIPQFIDTWIQGAKYNGFDLYEAMTDDEMSDKVVTWIVCNSETFAKAWFYGYEVEKEKLYTAKLKSTNEYLHYDKNYKKILHFRVPDDVVNQKEAYHFTEDDLIKYYAWENEAYDVKEVKR
ncbi:DUF1642 domain-containing protein [Streptococcus gallolyticus]|uniref:DUF1642 domain-containing protein n=1 Tax=Streptococcus gallolyticus TaxID=315405 RepID=UPI00201AC943|nr:DUF1642 domain-containing protein [Streptococcus gallolyticus]